MNLSGNYSSIWNADLIHEWCESLDICYFFFFVESEKTNDKF